jgi:hypothetical protein
MISSRAPRLLTLLALSTMLVGGCRSEFEPDITGPGTPPPPPPVIPNLPFRLGAFGPDYATGVVTDAADNALVVGYFSGSVDFDPGTGATVRNAIGGADVAVAKYRTDGSLAWVSLLSGSGIDLSSDIALTSDGGAVVTGVLSPGAFCNGRVVVVQGGRDAFLMKLSATGSCEWAFGIGGNDQSEEGRDLLVEPNGDIVLTGTFAGTVDFDPGAPAALLVSRGGTDAFLARYSADGTFKGVAQFGGIGNDAASAVVRTDAGDLVVGGDFTGTALFGSPQSPVTLFSAGDSDFFLAQLAPSLSLQWAVRGGGPGADYLVRNGLVVEFGGTVAAVGIFSGTADLDGGPGGAFFVSQGSTDVFFARFGIAGQYVGTGRQIGGPGSDGVSALLVDADNNFYLSGWFSGTVDFDPGPGVALRTAFGTGSASDAYMLSLTAFGDLRWVNTVGAVTVADGAVAIMAGLALTTDGALWGVGRFYGLADLDPGAAALPAQALGDSDQMAIRVEQGTGILRR